MTAVGVLNLDKPRGLTSAAVVGRLRRSSGARRVGHGGTLDPLASGVLPIFFGRATVLADLLSRQGKRYRAGVRFGAGSETDDAEGRLVAAGIPAELDAAAVEAALAGFIGAIEQRPPAYSAIKVEGERSYRRARAGRANELPARQVEVEALELVSWQAGHAEVGPLAMIDVRCGPGFYVRALARDLGWAVGTQAHLETLVRTSVGPLRLEDSLALDEAEARGPGLGHALGSPRLALAEHTAVCVDAAGVEALRYGRDVPAPGSEAGAAYAVDAVGRVLALGRLADGRFSPSRLVELE